MQRLRVLPLKAAATSVDLEKRIIYGVSMAQAVEALGHGGRLDAISVAQIVALTNGKRSGAKSRYTHPGLSSDGMGKFLGRMKNARVVGDKAIADLHLSDLAFKSPEGNLGEYVLSAAEEEPDAFGFSVVIDAERVWVLDTGEEIPVYDEHENRRSKPSNAVGDLPAFRVANLFAVDLVDEPAANRDGMFSAAHLWGTNLDAERVFSELDRYVTEAGFTPAKVYEIALKYAHARGVLVPATTSVSSSGMGYRPTSVVTTRGSTLGEWHDLFGWNSNRLGDIRGGNRMNEEQKDEEIVVEEEAQEIVEEEAQEEEQTPVVDEVAELRAALAAQAQAAAEAKQRAAALEAALDASNKAVADMQREVKRRRYADMAKGWHGSTDKHVAVLATLAEEGEDNDAFRFYVEHNNALAAQVEASALFRELGSVGEEEPQSARGKLEQVARRFQTEEPGLSWASALAKAAETHPDLYAEQRKRK